MLPCRLRVDLPKERTVANRRHEDSRRRLCSTRSNLPDVQRPLDVFSTRRHSRRWGPKPPNNFGRSWRTNSRPATVRKSAYICGRYGPSGSWSPVLREALVFASHRGRRRRRNGIRGIGPIHPGQVMQRDSDAPTIGRRPDDEGDQHNQQAQAQQAVHTLDSEVDHDDHRGKGQPIADDGEGPRVTCIACEDQTAEGTAFKLDPRGKQPPLATVRAAFT